MKRILLAAAAVGLLSIGPAPAHDAAQPAASAAEISPVLIGSKLPPLTLQTGPGENFDLNAAIEGDPAIIIFYRGGW